MQSHSARKEAIRSFKEQKTKHGIFAIRCCTICQTWVGSSRNLNATKNGAWFCLRTKSHRNKLLQDTWNDHGEDGFLYEVLEILDEDVSPILLSDILKDRCAHWIAQLDARPV